MRICNADKLQTNSVNDLKIDTVCIRYLVKVKLGYGDSDLGLSELKVVTKVLQKLIIALRSGQM